MASVITVVISNGDSIAQTNAKLAFSTDARQNVNALINYLQGCLAGANNSSTVQITTRDTDPSVSTSGTGSTQETETLH